MGLWLMLHIPTKGDLLSCNLLRVSLHIRIHVHWKLYIYIYIYSDYLVT